MSDINISRNNVDDSKFYVLIQAVYFLTETTTIKLFQVKL